ncbi:putative diacylglycerol O-acyltransferase [Seiridium cardinale]|uniref:diacylglycerol O-acyltransferase n=1 Tax=Seiridium cardinale TaxID=138064 RepID=A0ABR2XXF6_9PEZI
MATPTTPEKVLKNTQQYEVRSPGGTPRKFYLTKSRQNSISEKKMAETAGPKEDSFIHVSDAPTFQLRDPEQHPSNCDVKANGLGDSAHDGNSEQMSEKTLTDEPASGIHNGVSFAEALRDGTDAEKGPQNGSNEDSEPQEEAKNEETKNGEAKNGEAKNEEAKNDSEQTKPYERDDSDDRSDDSYPELDDMSLKEPHTQQPPLQTEPYAKIRWAPFNVPAKRRLQTLAVLVHCLCIGTLVSIFFALCANPFAWPLLLVYLMHLLTSNAATDGSLRYRSEWFRHSYIWDLFAGYFPAHLHKTHDLPPTRKYIFGYHPHGIISHGAWAAFATEALGFAEKFPGITNSLLTLENNFRIPLYRDYVLAMGVRSVSKDSIANILTRGGSNNEGMGRAVTIVIGGARESLEAQPGSMRLVLKQRKGFIKLAVRTGADLVPVLAFGENDLYDQLRPKEHPLVHKIQMFILKVWKFTLPFLHGRGIFNYDVGLMPYRRPLNVVVGAPIKVQQYKRVDDQEIDRLHDLYVKELLKLWDRYKDEFVPNRQEELEIV